MKLLKQCAGAAMLLALAGCASAPSGVPARLGLKLAPAALGESISVQQHLKVERNGRIDELDAALEIDPARMWNGRPGVRPARADSQLRRQGPQVLAPRDAAPQVRPDDVLEDVQLTLWPIDAIARALPPGWRIEDQGLPAPCTLDGAVVALVTYSAMPRWSGTITVDNQRYKYRLTIQSAP
jgi:hypothetical protein